MTGCRTPQPARYLPPAEAMKNPSPVSDWHESAAEPDDRSARRAAKPDPACRTPANADPNQEARNKGDPMRQLPAGCWRGRQLQCPTLNCRATRALGLQRLRAAALAGDSYGGLGLERQLAMANLPTKQPGEPTSNQQGDQWAQPSGNRLRDREAQQGAVTEAYRGASRAHLSRNCDGIMSF